MASSGRKVTIEFIGKDSGAGRTASDLERKFGTLGARMNKVGQVSGRILAGGLLLAGAAAIKAGQAAADDELAQAKLAQTLQKATGATAAQIAQTEEWISAQGRSLGITDDELRPAISKLAVATGDLGEAQRLAALAMDISAGSGKSLDSVVTALQKAQNGSVGGLARLGVATKNAAGETKSFDEIQQDLAKTYTGAAAKAADTTAGKQKILQVQFAELQEEIGARLIPVLTKLATAGLVVVDWIGKNQTTVAVLVGTLGGLLAITWATTKAIAAWTAITKIAAAAQIVFTNVQWALNAAMAANPVGLVVLAIVALVAALVIAYKKSETFRDIVNAAFGAVKDVALAVFGAITGAISATWGWIENHWPLLLAILTGPIGLAALAIAKNWDSIKAGVKAVKDFIIARFKDVATWLAGLPGKIKTSLSNLTSTVRTIFDDAMSAGLTKVKNIGATIVGWLTGIPTALGGTKIIQSFKNAGAALIGAVVDGMKNAAGVISGIAGNVWTAVKTMLNAAIDKINAALEFTIELPGPNISVNPPNIPHLAKGGVVSKPTLALIGEDGPEAVVPLGKKNAPRGKLGLGSGGDTYVFNISGALDPGGVAAQIERLLIGRNRVAGPLQFQTI